MGDQQDPTEGAVAPHEQQPAGEPEAPTGPVADAAPEQGAEGALPGSPADAAPEEARPVDPAPAAETPPAEAPTPAEGPAAEAPAPAEAPAAEAPAPIEAPAAEAPSAEPAPTAAEAAAPEGEQAAEEVRPTDPAPEAEAPPATADAPAVGPKILGRAPEERKVPVVRKRLQEKPKREPLPWPELRAAVAAVKTDVDVPALKELFRLFPPKMREEVTENVRGFQKGARRPVSQHAAKQLARAVHTARRQKKNSHPSGDVGEAIGQAMAAELIASLEPEIAAQVILPKLDLLEREARQSRRRARDDEDRRRDEERKRRREDAKSSRQQTSFGTFSGAKIQGLDEIAALFSQDEPTPAQDEPAPTTATPEDPSWEAAPAAEDEAPAPVEEPAPTAETPEDPSWEAAPAAEEAPEADPAPAPAAPDEPAA